MKEMMLTGIPRCLSFICVGLCKFHLFKWEQRLTSFQRRYAQTKGNSYSTTANIETRFNPLGIQMLSANLHEQIFAECADNPSKEAIERSIQHLMKHDLWNKETYIHENVRLKLPKLLGKSIAEHFHILGTRYSESYRNLADHLVETKLPRPPEHWEFRSGWTKYGQNGAEAVDSPEEKGLVFDVEVCLQQKNHFPTLATAASTHFWYSWCSKRLISDNYACSDEVTLGDLIPLELSSDQSHLLSHNWTERLVVGHNVAFDRSFVREQYFVDDTNQRFLDTMSLHMCVSGQTGEQRNMTMAYKNANNTQNLPLEMEWMHRSARNNLVDVYNLYCKKGPLDKDPRDIFVKGTLKDVRNSFQALASYCCRDVQATHEILQKVWPLFTTRFPHPATLAGMLEMSVSYLPVNQLWEKYLQKAADTYDQKERELKVYLARVADEACSMQAEDRYKKDVWLWDLDWSKQKVRSRSKATANEKKDRESKVDGQVNEISNKRQPLMASYPKWYRNLVPKPGTAKESAWEGKPFLLSTQMRCVPKLMRLTWDGYPLHYDKVHGWGYLVPGKNAATANSQNNHFPLEEMMKTCAKESWRDPEDVQTTESCKNDFLLLLQDADLATTADGDDARLWELICEKSAKKSKIKATPDGSGPPNHVGNGPYEDVDIPGCWFFRLPHKDGSDHRVGNPLAKDFLDKYSQGILRSHSGAQAQQALLLNMMLSYWKNAHKRIESQMVVWLQKEELSKIITRHDKYEEGGRYGVILPRLVTAGTVTRRAVEPTWLTASNAYADRIGSELKAMVQAPPGFHFVGADVDSQELWIAGLLGDAHFQGLHGCSAFGWMNLQGEKKSGTDMHSRIAKAMDITRDQAKVLNYGRIYGGGQLFTQRLLQRFNHRLSPEEARQKAKTLYACTKGVKSFQKDLAKGGGRKIWTGGSESHVFNKLEEIACSEKPTTPVLGCRISRALEPVAVSNNFMTSRINWVVQSSAVDFLHLMLICMRWLSEGRVRFVISIHDEIRYLAASEDRYRAALALQVTNLLVRSLFAFKLGINDLPQSVAFFSRVDIDTVLRKEVDMDCKTPSNPHGLQSGHTIPPGEAFDIHQILDKVKTLS